MELVIFQTKCWDTRSIHVSSQKQVISYQFKTAAYDDGSH